MSHNPTTTTSSANTGSKIGSDIRSLASGIHGAGEAIRGTVNQAVDSTFHDKAGEAKNRNVALGGIEAVKAEDRKLGVQHGVKGGAGVDEGNVGTRSTSAVQPSGEHAVDGSKAMNL